MFNPVTQVYRKFEPIFFMLLILIITIAVYASTVMMPYLLADDWWLVRNSPEAPALRYITLIQGRPILALIVRAVREITGNTDHPNHIFLAIELIRLVGIACLVFFSMITFSWLRKWGSSSFGAFVTVIVFLTLPSAQMFVVGGQWVAVGLLFAGLAAIFIDRYLYTDKLSTRSAYLIAASACLFISWGTYQATAFAFLALLLSPALSITYEDFRMSNHQSIPRNIKIVLVGGMIFIVTLIIYFILWKIVRFLGFESLGLHNSDQRYNPTFLNFQHNLFPIIHYFFLTRLPQMANLWYVNTLKISVPCIFIASIFVLGLILEAKRIKDRNTLVFFLIRTALIIFSLLVLDLSALSQLGPDGTWQPNYSFMTSGALSLGLVLIIADKIAAIWPKKIIKGVKLGAGLSVITLAFFYSSYTVLHSYTVPHWIEYQLVRAPLQNAITAKKSIKEIIFYAPALTFSRKNIAEHSWSNLSADFYAKLLIRAALDELGVESGVKIVYIGPNQDKSAAILNGFDNETTIIDLSHL